MIPLYKEETRAFLPEQKIAISFITWVNRHKIGVEG